MSAFGWPRGAPDFTWDEIPVAGYERPQPHPFLCPHATFAAIYKNRPDLWHEAILGEKNSNVEFWKQCAHDPDIQSHPKLHSAADRKKRIPLGMHGDGGVFSKQDSLLTISWNSLLGSGTTMRKRFVFTTIRKSQLRPDGSTLNAIWRVFCWSMNNLLMGVMAATDWRDRPITDGGQNLADGWAGALIQVRGDWEFYCQVFASPTWNTAIRCCWLCRASNTIHDLLWTNYNADASWRRTLWKHAGYLRFCKPREHPSRFC